MGVDKGKKDRASATLKNALGKQASQLLVALGNCVRDKVGPDVLNTLVNHYCGSGAVIAKASHKQLSAPIPDSDTQMLDNMDVDLADSGAYKLIRDAIDTDFWYQTDTSASIDENIAF